MTRALRGIASERDTSRETVQDRPEQATFVVEALLLMLCLMMVVAVSTLVIVHSVKTVDYYSHKEASITLAQNVVELFADDPDEAAGEHVEGDLVATCECSSHDVAAGTVYDALISVKWNDNNMYVLNTTRYVASGEGGNADGTL